MLTKWVKDSLSIIRGANNIPAITTTGTGATAAVTATTVTNTTTYISGNANSTNFSSLITSALGNSSAGIAIGSGETTPTENDYTLANQITSGFSGSAAAPSVVYDSENNVYISRIVVTITNTGESALTIKEIGLFETYGTAAALGSAISTGTTKSLMIDRTVLDSPLTIAAGTSGVIHYDFIMDGGATT